MCVTIGSYPRSYYEAAITEGRILVSGRKVECDYQIKGADELTHTVHRHEPAVALANRMVPDIDDPSKDNHSQAIVHEDDNLLVIDKPATLPIHPCGGYNFNSLFEVLSQWKPDSYSAGKLFTIHRLDRLTSGLVVIAKSSAIARSLGACIKDRHGCEKIYLARVKGKFPLNLQNMDRSSLKHPWEFHYVPQVCKNNGLEGEKDGENKCYKHILLPPCQCGELVEHDPNWRGGLRIPIINGRNNHSESGKSKNEAASFCGLGYWITDGSGNVILQNSSLQNLFDQCEAISLEEMLTRAIGSAPESGSQRVPADQSVHWLNFSSPCRISSHKNGICETGSFYELQSENDRKGIKPAQTSFTLLSYDNSSDTSLVVAKPLTGRTHQIRLHLQALGHPIANDHNYGGELWFQDEEGKSVSRMCRDWLNQLDRGGVSGTTDAAQVIPKNSTNADTPATEAEIYHAAANRARKDSEPILDFIEKTCVWCARCRGVDSLATCPESKVDNMNAVLRRTLMEYLVRSPGIWLHALQYSLKPNNDEGGEGKTLCYRTALPSWSTGCR